MMIGINSRESDFKKGFFCVLFQLLGLNVEQSLPLQHSISENETLTGHL